MTKSASIAILSIICVIALVLGVFACLPGGLEYGDYGVYNSATSLIQGDSWFTDSIVASYKVKLDDEAKIEDVISVLKARLGNMYGRYFCNVEADGTTISITIPETVKESNTSETTILSNITSTGKVEILTESSYDADDVILTSEHISRLSTQRYANSGTTYYIVTANLTKEGKAIAKENLTEASSSWSAYLAIDGTVSHGIAYTSNGTLQIYASNDADAQYISGLIKSGSLGAKLTAFGEFEEVSSIGKLVFGIVIAAIVLGSWIFYIVRYGKLAVAPIVSQLVVIVAFILFAGGVYFNWLNLASAIGIVLGHALMSCFTVLTFDKMHAYLQEKTVSASRYKAFTELNKWNCIVHAIVLVVGIVLWLIPTGVTAPLGNALVYCAVLSFVATMGLNRLFAFFNFGFGSVKSKKLAK